LAVVRVGLVVQYLPVHPHPNHSHSVLGKRPSLV
jgi:hypothetical protein